MNKQIIAAAIAATAMFGSAAVAQTAANQQTPPAPMARHHGGPMMMADGDKDGVLTKAELLAGVDARFNKFDANHDGKITSEERRAAFDAMRAKMAERRGPGGPGGPGPEGRPGMGPDGPKDGVVTLEERRASALKVFNYLDRNGDGTIDEAERKAFREAEHAMGGPGGPGHHGFGPHGRHGGPGGPGHGRFGPPPGGDDMPPPPPPAAAPQQ